MAVNMPMPSIIRSDLHIKSIEQNNVTGHVTMQANMIDVYDDQSEVHGVTETWGIDPLALKTMFGSVDDPVQAWLLWVKTRMYSNHEHRKSVHSALHTIAGKRV